MSSYSAKASGVDAATGFITIDAAHNLIRPALEGGAAVRLLTGTFGNNTRRKTFDELLRLSRDGSLETRIWEWNGRGNFHAKCYVWTLRLGGGSVGWIGSANLTNGGVQNEGELVLEIRGAGSTGTIRQLREAFESEWLRGRPLDAKFIKSYRESPRPAPDVAAVRPRLGRIAAPRKWRAALFFTAHVRHHMVESGAAVRRVRSVLGGTADAFFLHRSARLGPMRVGDMGVLFDRVDRTAELIHAVEIQKYGGLTAVAYQPAMPRTAEVRWTDAKARKARLAIGAPPGGLGYRILPSSAFAGLLDILYPGRRLPAAVRARLASAVENG